VKSLPHTPTRDRLGFRWSDKAEGRISTLLLGLYTPKGDSPFRRPLFPVFPQLFARELDGKLAEARAPGAISGDRVLRCQAAGRAAKLELKPVQPKALCEVSDDKLEKTRFRQGTRFIIPGGRTRIRRTCTWREVKAPQAPLRPDRPACWGSVWQDRSSEAVGISAGSELERLEPEARPTARHHPCPSGSADFVDSRPARPPA